MPAGCAYIFTDIVRNVKPTGYSKAIGVCPTATSGPINFDKSALTAKELIGKNGNSDISDVVLADNVMVTLYASDGASFVINTKVPNSKAFNKLKFKSTNTIINDNVFSLTVEWIGNA